MSKLRPYLAHHALVPARDDDALHGPWTPPHHAMVAVVCDDSYSAGAPKGLQYVRRNAAGVVSDPTSKGNS